MKQYSRVKLDSDKYADEGARRGMLGYIIEVYKDGHCEVEFSGADGTTVAQIVASESELILAPESESEPEGR